MRIWIHNTTCDIMSHHVMNLLLLKAGLMSRDESQNNAPVITRSGFQFLLMERSSQVHYNLSSGI